MSDREMTVLLGNGLVGFLVNRGGILPVPLSAVHTDFPARVSICELAAGNPNELGNRQRLSMTRKSRYYAKGIS